jgi:hypothetical protein
MTFVMIEFLSIRFPATYYFKIEINFLLNINCFDYSVVKIFLKRWILKENIQNFHKFVLFKQCIFIQKIPPDCL